MTETFSSVPKVDYARLTDEKTRQEELAVLRNAIFLVGFLYLTNTGLEVRETGSFKVCQGTDRHVGAVSPDSCPVTTPL